MSGNRVNGTTQALTPANYRGETLQVFVFFQGQYLGYQCFVQDRVTIGGSPSLDFYLPACSPEDGHWSFELARGTLLAWFCPLEQNLQKPQALPRRAVEPLDIFQLGEYRLQTKVLQASGFVQHYTGLECEPAAASFPEMGGPKERGQAETPKEAGSPQIRAAHPEDRPAPQSEPESAEAGAGGNKDFNRARTAPAGLLNPEPGAASSPGQEELLEKVHREVWGAPREDTTSGEGQAQGVPGESRNAGTENLLEKRAARTEIEIRQPLRESAAETIRQRSDPDAGGEEDLEEPDEADAREVPYFSLIKEIFRSCKRGPQAPSPNQRALEVVRFRAGDVLEVAYLEEDGSYAIRRGWTRRYWKEQGGPPPDFRMVSCREGGVAELRIGQGVRGRLYSKAGSRDIRGLLEERQGQEAVSRGSSRRHKPVPLSLPPDAWAVLRVDPFHYLVRYVPKRLQLPADPIRPRVTKSHVKLVSASLVSHIVLLLLIGIAIPKGTLEGYSPRDHFAKVDPDILKTFKTPEPPKPAKLLEQPLARPESKPVPPPKPKPAVTRPEEAPKAETRPAQEGPAEAKKPIDVAQTGLLAALDGPGAIPGVNPKGQSQILLAAVTNLDAVNVPADSTTFNLAGIAGKLGTSEIQIPTGDAIRTIGAQELMKNGGGSVGALASKGTGSGQVKAIVREPPKATITIRGGMSREAVLKVVNAHLDEIRDCYERELLHNPGLSGKILMEWLIQKDGAVGYAKVNFTNISHSSDLHVCVQVQVSAWKFPRPSDNQEVVVTFPFLFENMGF